MSNVSILAYPLSFSDILVSKFMFWFFVYERCFRQLSCFEEASCHSFASETRLISSVRFLCLIIVNRSFNFSMVIGVSSFSCFWLFLNDSMTLEKISSNYSIALFCFINSEFQNISYGFASTVAMKWFSFVKLVSPSTPRQVYNVLRWQIIEICFLMSGRKFIVANSWCSLFSVVCSGTITLLYQVNVCFWMLFIYLSFWLCWSNICTSGVATENIYPSFIKWGAP